MFFTRFILASLTVTTVLSLHEFHALKPNVFPKRQEYKPDSHTCGTGSCEEACGAGYEACGTRVCVNPSLNQVCCQANSAKPWGCPDGDYCLVDGWCCPKELDPVACALEHGVTLPADFVGPTAAPGLSNVTSAVATPTATRAPSTSAFTGLPEFTGAASLNTVAGGTGLLYAVMIMVGNLF